MKGKLRLRQITKETKGRDAAETVPKLPVKLHEDCLEERFEKGGRIKVLAGPRTLLDSRVILGKAVLKIGESIEEHCHINGEEVLYILEGQGIYSVGAEKLTFSPGDVLIARRGQPHSLENIGPSPVVRLVFASVPDLPVKEKISQNGEGCRP